MLQALEPLESLPAVFDVRGVGLMLGVELREGYDAAPVAGGCRARGVIVRATGQKIVMSPPLVIERDQANRIVEALRAEVEAL